MVDVPERAVAHAAQVFELIERGERVDRALMRTGEDDLPRDRMQRLR
jgi:hypothetical protein